MTLSGLLVTGFQFLRIGLLGAGLTESATTGTGNTFSIKKNKMSANVVCVVVSLREHFLVEHRESDLLLEMISQPSIPRKKLVRVFLPECSL